jgi:hypothetical protein
MTAMTTASFTPNLVNQAQAGGGTAATVMSVLRGIRPFGAGGQLYDFDTGLSDAGFTSVEMVQVMLGIEAAFDVMIPQELITPENFRDANAIVSLVGRMGQAA